MITVTWPAYRSITYISCNIICLDVVYFIGLLIIPVRSVIKIWVYRGSSELCYRCSGLALRPSREQGSCFGLCWMVDLVKQPIWRLGLLYSCCRLQDARCFPFYDHVVPFRWQSSETANTVGQFSLGSVWRTWRSHSHYLILKHETELSLPIAINYWSTKEAPTELLSGQLA